MKTVGYVGFVALFSGCMLVHARTAHTGHLVAVLADRETGRPITNATVTVRCQTKFGLSYTLDSFFTNTCAQTDSNGVADVTFQFYNPDFNWWVDTPSHYSEWFRVGSRDEQFGCVVENSDYFGIDTNTVDGLAKYNELVSLHNSGDIVGYLAKFEPKSVTYTENTAYRSASFYPKRNPQPMYAYGEDIRAYLSMKHTTENTNGVEIAHYKPEDFDMRSGCVIPENPERLRHFTNRIGEVSDFHIERFCVTTNGVKNFYGWIDFAPGCGAYIRKMTGDDSFPTTYVADTNATFLTRIPFEYHSISGKLIHATRILEQDEYMVLRTRVMTNSLGVVTNCNYSKILGPMKTRKEIQFKHMVFNPRPNDPNLEFDMENNMAEDHGSNRYP